MSLNFDVLAEAYDAMIDWDKRLANESGLFRKVFDEVKARRVIDAACGTGRHAAMFARWGLEVEGADLNARMIEHCQAKYQGVGNLSFVTRSFMLPISRPADVVVCTGNSLALVDNLQQAEAAIAAMCAGVLPGGALVIHVLNLQSREEGPIRWDKCKRTLLSSGDALIIKGTHRAGGYGYVNFLLTDLSGSEPKLTVDTVRFLQLRSEFLETQCKCHGFKSIELYGNYRMEAFDPARSSDLIIVARR